MQKKSESDAIMESNREFTYHYSSKQSSEAQRIRRRYLPNEDKLEKLKKLDYKAQSAGAAESIGIGVIGLLIFGVGLCFGLGVFGGAWWLSIPLGILGIIIMLPAYYVYRRISEKTKAALTPEILRLSDEIINRKNEQ